METSVLSMALHVADEDYVLTKNKNKIIVSVRFFSTLSLLPQTLQIPLPTQETC